MPNDNKQNVNIFRKMAQRIQSGMDDLYKSDGNLTNIWQ